MSCSHSCGCTRFITMKMKLQLVPVVYVWLVMKGQFPKLFHLFKILVPFLSCFNLLNWISFDHLFVLNKPLCV